MFSKGEQGAAAAAPGEEAITQPAEVAVQATETIESNNVEQAGGEKQR